MFKETLSYVKTNCKSWAFHHVSKIGASHPGSLQPKFREKLMKTIVRKGDIFYDAVMEGRLTVPGIGDLMWFAIWKGNPVSCRESLQRTVRTGKRRAAIKEPPHIFYLFAAFMVYNIF